ncbi:hypothetical protein HN512_02905 [Candidatus Peregrinibacteria bacterium]|jgi:hypothetical protein|nr:hypothetical protein [Candidatus Peregrinibacteria bacterium]MBT3598762.1 hypothetical protein [Candidatus Peregrinibacteria bacterium]MBT4367570.1 hypothetical protein [Candidatus Peregrinibacteria bacterium]MBT4585830.1 hypothetical protein [Candidatus Peregrinibacteria bacterium]MBT6731228.1 hypothetical protein [Candidatus Peregrinibacteria bacterium]
MNTLDDQKIGWDAEEPAIIEDIDLEKTCEGLVNYLGSDDSTVNWKDIFDAVIRESKISHEDFKTKTLQIIGMCKEFNVDIIHVVEESK